MAAAPQQIAPRINHITRQIIGAAMRVHTVLGPGLLESAYQACLLRELRKQGLAVARQVGLQVVYEGERIELGYRIDLIVGDVVIVEIKCVDASSSSAATVLHAVKRKASRPADQLPRGPPSGWNQAHG